MVITFEADETWEVPDELEDALDTCFPYWDYEIIFTDGGDYDRED